jgi:hypothetical protein
MIQLHCGETPLDRRPAFLQYQLSRATRGLLLGPLMERVLVQSTGRRLVQLVIDNTPAVFTGMTRETQSTPNSTR